MIQTDAQGDPERDAVLADSVGLAFLVVLESLSPAERLAFVLHDVFAVPFDEIATIVDRTPEAARQLASRARRRIGRTPREPGADLTVQRQVVDAFLAASRAGISKGSSRSSIPTSCSTATAVAPVASRGRRSWGRVPPPRSFGSGVRYLPGSRGPSS